MSNLFASAAACLALTDPDDKIRVTEDLARAWEEGRLEAVSTGSPAPIGEPGRPERPPLVAPRELSSRGLGTVRGRAALIHAIAHIELNAVNLAWDAVYRFPAMPREFQADWIRVAAEEARHFRLLRDHLRELGCDYGDFPAHHGLWEMACRTACDPLVRMALVPRVLEARGLDVTPGMMQRLGKHGDMRAVAILEVILREEIGHVAIGSRWYHHLCRERGLDPVSTFRTLVRQHMKGGLKGPFNLPARRAAGFEEAELMPWSEESGERD